MKTEIKSMMINKSGISHDYSSAGTFRGHWKFVFDGDKLIICPRAKKMLELSKTPGIGMRDILDLLQPGYAIKLMREFKYACSNEANLDLQLKILTPSGKIKWIKISGVLYHRRWGKADQMIGTIEDTTQKVSEECLSMAVVNHEIRSPLTIIKLNVQILTNLLSTSIENRPVKLLKTVDMHINFMTKIIEQYMTSPVDDKRSPVMSLSVFDLNALVETMVGEMKTLHQAYRFCKQASQPVWVNADKYKIIQVLINYLTNAVNFSPSCSQITVEIINDDDNVTVAIRDQGVGVPAGQEQQIFQKFYRGDDKAVRQKNSKGLGLYLVKNIIRQHGGSVSAERGESGGSVFYFSLPVYKNNGVGTAHWRLTGS